MFYKKKELIYYWNLFISNNNISFLIIINQINSKKLKKYLILKAINKEIKKNKFIKYGG